MSTFKEGDRVCLITTKHGDNERNPIWGGKYGKIRGTVTKQKANSEGKYFLVDWDNGESSSYYSRDLKLYKGVSIMKETAKKAVASIHDTIKPYEKYIGLIALAVVIDHFILDNKFSSRFIALGEAIVLRITDGMDKVINKLTDGILEDKKEEK